MTNGKGERWRTLSGVGWRWRAHRVCRAAVGGREPEDREKRHCIRQR